MAVSKVLCYVCHSWAGLCHTTLLSTMTPTTSQTPHPHTRSHARPTVPTTPLVQDTKCTSKAKAQPQPYTWHIFYFYVGLMSKYMKHEFALPSLKKQTRTVSVCVCKMQPFLHCNVFLKRRYCFFEFTFYLSIYSTIKRKGTFCGLFFSHSIATYHCK